MKLWLGRFVSIIALGFVGYFLFSGFKQISQAEIHFRMEYLALSLIFGLVYFLCRNFSWMKLIRQRRFPIQFIPAAHYFSTSEIIRYIPGNVWGLGARVVKGPSYGVPKESSVILLIEDTALLLSSVAVLSGTGLLFTPNIAPIWKSLGVILILSISLMGILPFIIKKGMRVISKIFSYAFSATGISVKKLSSLYPIYVVGWLAYALSQAFLFYAVFSGQNLFMMLLTFSVLSWLIGYASLITPSGLGVRELILSIGLASAISSGVASLFALISRVWFTVIELLFFAFIILVYKKPVHEETITHKELPEHE